MSWTLAVYPQIESVITFAIKNLTWSDSLYVSLSPIEVSCATYSNT